MSACKGTGRRGASLLLLLASGAGCASPGPRLRVMSFEIGCQAHKERPWDERKVAAVERIQVVGPDILATQGGTAEAIAYLREHLEGYRCASSGEGRAAELAIFWRADRIERFAGAVIAPGTRNAAGPEKGSAPDENAAASDAGGEGRSAGKRQPPYASWAHFRVKSGDPEGEGELFLVNVHLDERQRRAREAMAQALRSWLRPKGRRAPAVMTGGFHDTPLSRSFYTLTEADTRRKVMASALGGWVPPFLVDAWATAGRRRGPGFTFLEEGSGDMARLDWILVQPRIRVLRAETVRLGVGIAVASGHFPVVVDLELPVRR